MKQFVLDYLAAECCKAPHVAGFTRDENGDLLLTLDNGKLIAIYVINRAIRLADIRERYEENTAQGLHTLYVVDRRMLPEANESIDPPYWMSALHTLMHGRIYTYSYDNREVQIRHSISIGSGEGNRARSSMVTGSTSPVYAPIW